MQKPSNFKAYLIVEQIPWLKQARIVMDFESKEDAEKEVERLNSKAHGGNYYLTTISGSLLELALKNNE